VLEFQKKTEKQKIKKLAGGEETILVVDDDPAVLRAHTRLISKLGYNVQRALGGQEAIDYIKKNHADLIILDLLMPGLDGIETFRAIKEVNPYQRAIVLSGFAGPAMVNSIKILGVNTYLVKPAEVGILAQAIRDEIDRA
jgi:CheY-like chemotaxis protein